MQIIETSIHNASGFSTDFFHTLIKQRPLFYATSCKIGIRAFWQPKNIEPLRFFVLKCGSTAFNKAKQTELQLLLKKRYRYCSDTLICNSGMANNEAAIF